VGRLFLDLTLDEDSPLPAAVAHRFAVTLTSPNGPPTTIAVSGSRTSTASPRWCSTRRWLVGGGCCFPPSYRRTATLTVNGHSSPLSASRLTSSGLTPMVSYLRARGRSCPVTPTSVTVMSAKL
jgi:hypothetical protein